jgi:hypothetical protein
MLAWPSCFVTVLETFVHFVAQLVFCRLDVWHIAALAST